MSHYLTQSKAQNRAFNQSRADDRHTPSLMLLAGAAVFAGGLIIGAEFMPMPAERSYQLVQIDMSGESEIIDYRLSATDCGLSKSRLEVRGYHVVCEVETN